MSIKFGAVPVGYQGDKDEKILEERRERLRREGELAIRATYMAVSGMERLVELLKSEDTKSTIEQGQCNCAKEETESAKCGETDRKPEETPEERQIRELGEQRERLRRADELVITAIRLEIFGMEKLEALLDREDTTGVMAIEYARTIAEAGNAVARLRGGMAGMPVYGYGV